MDISVIVPLLNEEESLPELEAWIRRVMEAHNFSYEIIMIDDGSTDQSWTVIEGLRQKNESVRGIKFRRNYGKSAALHTGFQASQGAVVITMDADLQDSPDEIPDLYRMITKEGYDLVSGWKKKRYDPFIKNFTSKFFNGVTRWISKIQLHDFNCGLKAYKSQVIKSIEVYGEMHRYIPLIAKWAGFKKIGEKVVQHQARKYGTTKFGLERFINGFLDLLSITFVGKFGKRPMHLFGVIGTIMFILGFVSALYLGVDKLIQLSRGVEARLVADNPIFYIALTCMIIGSQLFLAGFVAELVARNSPGRNQYEIEKVLGEEKI
ncbi:MAG TPA: glycosyltransferase family 2 protein [Saprospiraceae bacterium]|nr:glycosyltransferase family 2 protein [Saprospiraceae bacterium]